MILKGLELDFFRNYVHTEVTFSPGVNVIWGENDQGKTNLLEADSTGGSGGSCFPTG